MEGRPRTPRPVSAALMALDAVLVVLLGLLAAGSLRESYGGAGWVVAMAGGLFLGVCCAVAGTLFRLGPWGSALSLLAAYFVFGSSLALPASTDPSRVPSPSSLRDLATGLVESWRNSLTLATPLGEVGDVLVVPLVIGLVGGFVAASLLWRSRWPGATSLVLAAVLVASSAFGDRFSAQTTVRGVVLLLATLVWLRLRASRHVRGGWTRRVVLTGLVVLVASGVGAGVSRAVTGPSDRAVLREQVQPPFDPRDYPSPLSRFRAYKKDLETTPLLKVHALPEGARIRIATMDYFDGIVWNVTGGPGAPESSGSFAHLGRGRPATSDSEVTVSVDGLTGVWVPSVGATTGVRVDEEAGTGETSFLYNSATGTMAQVGGLRAGTTYTLSATVAPSPTEAEIAAATSTPDPGARPPENVPERLAALSDTWIAEAGATTAGAQAAAIATTLHEKGYYSNGLGGEYRSTSGHGARRIDDLVATPSWVGDEEQYASAMAIATQRLDIDSRVVIGFRPETSDVVLTGKDVTAWVEVRLDGLGWVAFDPAPDETRVLEKPDDEPDPRPQPQVLQPPDTPVEAQEEDVDVPQGGSTGSDKRPDETTGGAGVLLKVVKVVAVTAGAGTVLLSPLWIIALLKSRRRRRRKLLPDPVDRISAGWREITDNARDLGVRIDPGVTRHETSRIVVDRFPRSEVHVLAATADEHVFGPDRPSDEEVAAYWEDVDSAMKRMRRSVPPWWRVAHRFSWASLPWREGLARAGSAASGRVASLASGLRTRLTRTKAGD